MRIEWKGDSEGWIDGRLVVEIYNAGYSLRDDEAPAKRVYINGSEAGVVADLEAARALARFRVGAE